MPRLKSFYLLIVIIFTLTLLPFIGLTNNKAKVQPKGSEIISIDLPAETSSSKMPFVNFRHTLHNQAANNDCAKCHLKKDDTFVFKFKRTEAPASMEIYHDNCISCHTEAEALGKKSGPLTSECRSCHGINKEIETSWSKINFDKSLHFIHETSKTIKPGMPSEENNCSACHHKFNSETKKTYYAKGEEESCVYCHKENIKNDTRSLKNASHDSCVACHTSLQKKDVDAGPITCNGCHDVKEQSKIKVAKNITRLKRNQPDAALIKGRISPGKNPKYFMNPVAFNHKLHESKANDCKACHHISLKKCNECHTSKGNKDGNFIPLEQAMHKLDSNKSCIGCHKETTKQSDCAACHDTIPQQQLKENSCTTCHNTDDNSVIFNKDLEKTIAKQIIEKQADSYSSVPSEKIPETVIIDELSNEYKPSKFPHRKVVEAISKRVIKNDLANAFHKDQQTLCSGCHHNSPKSLEPPKCASCHGQKADIAKGKPNLKGAYHGQCITCHQKMDVKQVLPTDCNKCHEQNKVVN